MSKAYPMVPLGEVLTLYQEYINEPEPRSYPKLSVKLYGKGVVLDTPADGSSLKMQRHQIAKSGQVILSEIWGKKGAIGIVPPEGEGALCTSHFFLFDICQEKIDTKYLQAIFTANYLQEQLDNEAKGTTGYAAVRPKHLLSATIPLPPLEEQQRIVARIEELAAKIEEARGLQKEAVEEAESLLESAINLTFERMNSVERKPLVSLTSKIGSGSTPAGGRSAYPSSGIPFIRSLNVRMRQFTWEGIAFIDQATHESMRGTQVKPNDVLLNITGASIGRVACAPSDLIEANVNQHVAIIRPLELLDARYLVYWLSQPNVQDFINNEQKGATRQGFTKAQIEAFNIPLPPQPEQQRIVAYLDDLQAKVDMLKRKQAEVSAQLDAMLPSILDKAFKGEL
jgi:type I restriction enzyme S subunit